MSTTTLPTELKRNLALATVLAVSVVCIVSALPHAQRIITSTLIGLVLLLFGTILYARVSRYYSKLT